MTKKKIIPLPAVAGVLTLLNAVLLPYFVFCYCYWVKNHIFSTFSYVIHCFSTYFWSAGLDPRVYISCVISILILISAIFIFMNKRNYLITASLFAQFILFLTVNWFYIRGFARYLLAEYFSVKMVAFFGICFDLAYLAMAILSFIRIKNPASKFINRWWLFLVPSGLAIVFSVLANVTNPYDISRIPVIPCLLMIVATSVMMYWFTRPYTEPLKEQKKAKLAEQKAQAQQQTTAGGTVPQAVTVSNEAYCDMAKHVLLLFLTCGIYMYVWIYRMTEYTNYVQGEEYRDPTKKLLLCMFVPFYSVYWIYKTAQRIDKMATAKGIQSDSATLCLILALFVGIVPPILMQDKMNRIITAPAQPVAVSTSATASTADELKKFKDLLDSGVITQEEFDAKKKQLLGM